MYHLQATYAALSADRVPLAYTLGERLYVTDRDRRVRDILVLDSGSFKMGKPFALEQHHVASELQQ